MNTREEVQTLIGKNLRRIRQHNNITVEKLGLESGIGYSQVSRIELENETLQRTHCLFSPKH